MVMEHRQIEARKRRHTRVRSKVFGTASRPRLSVFRSARHIYAQLIDDVEGCTLVSASTLDPDVKARVTGKTKVDAAALVGDLVARRALASGIGQVVFDRGGYKYHGRVKALAQAAREGGIEL